VGKKQACMHAQKWVSNSDSYGRILKEYQVREVNIKDNKDTVPTTLGL